ncbi:MAG: 1-acyl-sn-glycerol-3-phosphate acyltransferase [Acidobacteria bacterium]|nr:1-acyl-sn-glycerol-3-phosphate acyltransferase [Acidobacteriota bacterium]
MLIWILGGLALALAVSLCFLLTPFMGGRRAFWLVAPRYIRLTAWAFGIRREMEGWGALPEGIRNGSQAALFIGNHASLFDPPLMISTLPCRPVFIAKRELARVPFLGWVIWLADFIFIDRDQRGAAKHSLDKAADRIRAGQSVVAFPEGTRSRDGKLLPFKKGVFNLAFATEAPVVPFAIEGGLGILPKDTWQVRGGPYRIRVGVPLNPAQYPDRDALLKAAEEAVRGLMTVRRP